MMINLMWANMYFSKETTSKFRTTFSNERLMFTIQTHCLQEKCEKIVVSSWCYSSPIHAIKNQLQIFKTLSQVHTTKFLQARFFHLQGSFAKLTTRRSLWPHVFEFFTLCWLRGYSQWGFVEDPHNHPTLLLTP